MFKRFLVLAATAAWLTALCTAQTNTLPTTGNVGIGTTSPDKTLEVNGGIHLNMPGGINWSNNQSLLITNAVDTAAGDTGAQIWHGDSGAGGSHLLIFSAYPQTSYAFTGGYMVLNTQTGKVGIGTAAPWDTLSIGNGTGASPGATLGLSGISGTSYSFDLSTKLGNYLQILSEQPSATPFVISGAGNVGIGTTTPNALLEVNGNEQMDGSIIFSADGSKQTTAWTGVLCGGDYAESVGVSDDRTHYEPGDLIVVDSDAPGKFLKSAEPYSTLVAGIYSTKPGVVGRRTTDAAAAKDEIPMAMVGIVPAKVSAENGPVKAGDLLVASSTPGYAMKGTDHERLTGAVIGKALGVLQSGTGVINVLVTLQ